MVLRLLTRAEAQRPALPAPADAWWALGDAPVRGAETLVPLIDGRAAMLAMCVAFLKARRRIWLADWGLYVQMRMVRGCDQRAGLDGSKTQYALIEPLRAAGLDRPAIALWESGPLRVVDVLAFAARRGVDVRVLLWGPFDPGGMVHMVNDPALQQRKLIERGVACRLDTSSRSPLHVAQSLHQKCAVVDDDLAFVGGVDLTIQPDGDYDRWDFPAHPLDAPLRGINAPPVGHGWHDVHVMLGGPPSEDVARNFEQRWDGAHANLLQRIFPPYTDFARMRLAGQQESGRRARHAAEEGQPALGADTTFPAPVARVQVVRTIPALTYPFAPRGVHSLVQSYILAIRQARRFIYFENQYLWLEGYQGLDMWRIGWQSPSMKALLGEVADAAERGVSLAFLLPDHPNAGRCYTDDTIAWLRGRAPNAQRAGRLRFFTLAASAPGDAGSAARYRPIYVHAKVAVVDDEWATVGSANLNSRGMSHDAEMNVSVLNAGFARSLRLALWREHLDCMASSADAAFVASPPLPEPLAAPAHQGMLALLRHDEETPRGDDALLAGDAVQGIACLCERADENLRRLCRGELLRGHLLPYLPFGEGASCGVDVDREHGYLDPLQSRIEQRPAPHPGKYI